MNLLRIILVAFILFTGACTSQKKLIYFQGEIPPLNSDSVYVIRIKPGDILSVNIFTTNTEAYPYLAMPNERLGTDNRSSYEKGYLVNDSGQIKLPLIGGVNINNLTLSEATRKVESRFREFIEDPIITLKILNFKVTVLGELNKPGTYQIMNEKATLPEVLGLAGDLTQFADRQMIRIIREEKGKRTDFFVDLTSANSLTAQSYYVHPDDIIYVAPVKRRAFQNTNPSVMMITSILTTAVVIMTFIVYTK